MPYFPVDDNLHAHPKVDVAGLAAMGLWTLAGSWSKQATTGGYVPAERVPKLGGTKALAAKLVKAGLWVVCEGGYQFHDWEHQAGNFDAETEKARRDAERERWREVKRQKRERERVEKGERPNSPGGTRHGTPGPVPLTPSPIPNPSPRTSTDGTNFLQSSPELDARPRGLDPVRDLIDEKRLEVTLMAERVGIIDLPAVRATLEAVTLVEGSREGAMTLKGAYTLAIGILGKAKDQPVKKPEAYIASACRRSPDEIREGYFQLDIGAVA